MKSQIKEVYKIITIFKLKPSQLKHFPVLLFALITHIARKSFVSQSVSLVLNVSSLWGP